jgi:AraC-like DNA-binding protein
MRVIRLERAAALLRNGRSVTEAAALTGFDNPKYFSTVFKKYFGVSPSRYNT